MRHLRLTLLVCLVACMASAPALARDPGDLLSDQRWSEQSFGLSLLPPAEFQRLEPPVEGALVTFVDPTPTAISVLIRQAQVELNLNTLKQQAIVEMTLGLGEAVVIDDQAIHPGGRLGTVMYLPIISSTGQNRVFGLGLVKIDPQTVVIFRMETAPDAFDRERARFEAMIHSMELMDPLELNRIRTAWINAGQRWHDGLERDNLKQAMHSEQWLRVLGPEERDVGYVRIRQRLDTMLGLDGLHIEIASRMVVGADSYDTESFFFESDDASVEVWSVKTAKRTLAPQPRLPSNVGPPQGPRVVTETGIRSGDTITVKREAPGSIDNLEWPTPPTAYLSQVELHLLPALLPRNRQQEFAFYAYNTSDGRITLRTMQIYPLPQGGYVVRERSAPGRAEQIATYDAQGRLVRRQLPNGTIMLPATADQMRIIWNIR